MNTGYFVPQYPVLAVPLSTANEYFPRLYHCSCILSSLIIGSCTYTLQSGDRRSISGSFGADTAHSTPLKINYIIEIVMFCLFPVLSCNTIQNTLSELEMVIYRLYIVCKHCEIEIVHCLRPRKMASLLTNTRSVNPTYLYKAHQPLESQNCKYRRSLRIQIQTRSQYSPSCSNKLRPALEKKINMVII